MFWYLKWFFKDRKGSAKILWHMSPSMAMAFMIMISGIIQTVILSAVLKDTSALAGGIVAILISEVVGISIQAFDKASNIYYGQFRGDKITHQESIKETTAFKIVMGYCIFVLAIVLVTSIGAKNIISATSKDKTVVEYGADYLNFSLIVWATLPLFYSFNFTLLASDKAHVSLLSCLIGVGINLLTVWLLVSPKIGSLGIKGIPIGNAISNFVQIIVLISYILWKKPKWTPKLKFWEIDKFVWRNTLITGIVISLADVIAPVFTILLNLIIYRSLPSNPRQATSITVAVIPIFNLFLGIFYYMVSTGLLAVLPRYVGKRLGRSKYDEAKLNSQKILGVATWINIVFSLIILSSAWWYPLVYSGSLKTELSKEVAKYMLIGSAFCYFFYKTASSIVATIRTGSKLWYQLLISVGDQIPYYIVYLPLTFVLLYYHCLPIPYVFMVMAFTPVIQYSIAICLYYKLDWTKNLINKDTFSEEREEKVEKNVFV